MYLFAVTVLGKDWLTYIWSGKIILKQFIYNAVNAGKDIPAIDPFVIIGSGGSNRKVITFVPVPFRINPVQSKRHDSQNICPDGVVGPGGIDFAAGYIFDVIFVAYIIIACSGIVDRPIVYHYIFRDNDLA